MNNINDNNISDTSISSLSFMQRTCDEASII